MQRKGTNKEELRFFSPFRTRHHSQQRWWQLAMKHGCPRAPWLAQPGQREGSAQLPGVVQGSSAPAGSFPQRPPWAAWRLPHCCFRQRCCSPRGSSTEHTAWPSPAPSPLRTRQARWKRLATVTACPEGAAPAPKPRWLLHKGMFLVKFGPKMSM